MHVEQVIRANSQSTQPILMGQSVLWSIKAAVARNWVGNSCKFSDTDAIRLRWIERLAYASLRMRCSSLACQHHITPLRGVVAGAFR